MIPWAASAFRPRPDLEVRRFHRRGQPGGVAVVEPVERECDGATSEVVGGRWKLRTPPAGTKSIWVPIGKAVEFRWVHLMTSGAANTDLSASGRSWQLSTTSTSERAALTKSRHAPAVDTSAVPVRRIVPQSNPRTWASSAWPVGPSTPMTDTVGARPGNSVRSASLMAANGSRSAIPVVPAAPAYSNQLGDPVTRRGCARVRAADEPRAPKCPGFVVIGHEHIGVHAVDGPPGRGLFLVHADPRGGRGGVHVHPLHADRPPVGVELCAHARRPTPGHPR